LSPPDRTTSKRSGWIFNTKEKQAVTSAAAAAAVEGSSKQTTGIRGWFRRKYKSPWFWLATIVVLFIISVLITFLIYYFYLWVEFPTVHILKFGITPNSLGADLGGGGLRSPSARLQLDIEVEVINDNRMDVVFDFINITMAMTDQPGLVLGTKQLYNVVYPKLETVRFPLAINVSYTMSSDPDSAVPKQFVRQCGIPPNKTAPAEPLYLFVEVTPIMRIAGFITYNVPALAVYPTFDCPGPFNQILDFGIFKIDLNKLDWKKIQKGQFF
jgi:hypothetical protein